MEILQPLSLRVLGVLPGSHLQALNLNRSLPWQPKYYCCKLDYPESCGLNQSLYYAHRLCSSGSTRCRWLLPLLQTTCTLVCTPANMTGRPRLQQSSLMYPVAGGGGCQFRLRWSVYVWPHSGVPYNMVASCQLLKLYYLLQLGLETSHRKTVNVTTTQIRGKEIKPHLSTGVGQTHR